MPTVNSLAKATTITASTTSTASTASASNQPFVVQTINSAEKYVQTQTIDSSNKLFSHILQLLYNNFMIAPNNMKLGGALGSNLHWLFYVVALMIGGVLFGIQFLIGQWGETSSTPSQSMDKTWMNMAIAIILTIGSAPLLSLIVNVMYYTEKAISYVIYHTPVPTGAAGTNFVESITGFWLCLFFPPLILAFLMIAIIMILIVSIQVGMELIKLWMLMILAPLYNVSFINTPSLVKNFWLEVLSICLSQIGQLILLNLVFFLSDPLLQLGALLLAIQSPAIIKQYVSGNNASVLMTPISMFMPQMASKSIGFMNKFGFSNMGMNLFKKILG